MEGGRGRNLKWNKKGIHKGGNKEGYLKKDILKNTQGDSTYPQRVNKEGHLKSTQRDFTGGTRKDILSILETVMF